jgi:hypothetical protein
MKTDSFFQGTKTLGKMKNIHNALSDVLETYNGILSAQVIQDPNNEKRWKIQVRHNQSPNSFLEIEILEIDNEPIGCVLQQVNIGRRSMFRFMDRLLDALDLD